MSKSLGNSPDPIDLIEKYGADGVRVGMLLCSPAGNDLPFDESLCEQGRNFSNKIWNAFRLVKGFTVEEITQPDSSKIAVEWFDAKFNEQLANINDLYSKYRMSEALMATYKLVWDDFCAWYLEMIKPEFVDGKSLPIDKQTYDATINFFEKILKVLHPFMPFITEEIWHLIKERSEKDCIIVSEWPKTNDVNQTLLDEFEIAREVIINVRNIRAKYNTKNLSQTPKIAVWRKTYSAFGAKPKENKSSVENLYRLVLQGVNLRHINKLVDIYSFISLKHMVPVGGEDIDKIEGDVALTFAEPNEPAVLLLGDKEPRPPHIGEVIYKDNISAICRRWNWREADRTKFTEDFTGMDVDVGRLPGKSAHDVRLVDQDARVGQREALLRRPRRQQHRRHRRRLPDADSHHVRLDVLHGVVDRHARGDRPSRRVDIELDVLLRVLRRQEQQLRDHQVGDVVVNRRPDKNDVVAQQPTVDVVGALAAAGLLDHHRN